MSNCDGRLLYSSAAFCRQLTSLCDNTTRHNKYKPAYEQNVYKTDRLNGKKISLYHFLICVMNSSAHHCNLDRWFICMAASGWIATRTITHTITQEAQVSK